MSDSPTDTLKRISALATEWDSNKLGPISLQRKRWQKIGEIARDALNASVLPTAPTSDQAETITALEQERDAAAQAVFEKCAQATCIYCFGVPMIDRIPILFAGISHVHYLTGTNDWKMCHADSMRNALPERSAQMDEKARGESP